MGLLRLASQPGQGHGLSCLRFLIFFDFRLRYEEDEVLVRDRSRRGRSRRRRRCERSRRGRRRPLERLRRLIRLPIASKLVHTSDRK